MTSLRSRLVAIVLFSPFFLGTLASAKAARAEALEPDDVARAGASADRSDQERVFTPGQAQRMKVPGGILTVSGALMFALTSVTNSDGADQAFDRSFILAGAIALPVGAVLFGFGLRRELLRRPSESSTARALRLDIGLSASPSNLGPSLELVF